MTFITMPDSLWLSEMILALCKRQLNLPASSAPSVHDKRTHRKTLLAMSVKTVHGWRCLASQFQDDGVWRWCTLLTGCLLNLASAASVTSANIQKDFLSPSTHVFMHLCLWPNFFLFLCPSHTSCLNIYPLQWKTVCRLLPTFLPFHTANVISSLL